MKKPAMEDFIDGLEDFGDCGVGASPAGGSDARTKWGIFSKYSFNLQARKGAKSKDGKYFFEAY